jgi:hypothetical protein
MIHMLHGLQDFVYLSDKHNLDIFCTTIGCAVSNDALAASRVCLHDNGQSMLSQRIASQRTETVFALQFFTSVLESSALIWQFQSSGQCTVTFRTVHLE